MFELLDFSLHNLRSIKDAKNIELSKINFLLGMNGSGKSTFMRFFQILHQSLNVRTKAPLLFYGNDADFGGFDNSICAYRDEGDDSIGFGAKFNVGERRRGPDRKLSNTCMDFYISIAQRGENTFIKQIKMFYLGNHIVLFFSERDKISKISINDQNFTENLKKQGIEFHTLPTNIFPYFVKKNEQGHRTFVWYRDRLCPELLLEAKKWAHPRTDDDNFLSQLHRLDICEDNHNQKILLSKGVEGSIWKKKIDALSSSDPAYKELINTLILSFLPSYIELIENFLTNMTRATHYIGPVRATAQRFYRKQELAVDQIDAFGENVPQFISSLTKNEKESFCKWTNKFFDFSADSVTRPNQIEIKIRAEGLDEAFDLTDVGFGYSQILPILLQLWKFMQQGALRRSEHEILFFIEQPELHLHPAYQTKLIDAICDAIQIIHNNNGKIKIFIETHSETMINAIGDNIAREFIPPDDVSILTFEKKKGICSIDKASFNDDAILENWPIGFLSGRS